MEEMFERMVKCVAWWQEACWILTEDDDERNKHLATTAFVLHSVVFQRIDGMLEKSLYLNVLPSHV